ncbi:hypothetical protein K402DRAFT_458686 [Aulographum hederae CBS 113979]|uniref:Uncharacterized protein n=1 Tax=Aulographum hederae CBS 113979 TaxID=1176131 RepID=A0A6G1HGU3_9PEZI|nr:hypothetical protein K402DRAFT_458686 [Aulographum hederae CBS 113979]
MATARAFDPPFASELFLLENRDGMCPDDVKTQSTRLFKEFVEMGSHVRWQYHQALRSGHYNRPTDHQVSSILQPARTPTDREAATVLQSTIPLRLYILTGYINETGHLDDWDEDDNGLVTGECGTTHLVLNDESQYTLGEDWKQILYRVPEIIGSYWGDMDPEEVQRRISEVQDDIRADIAAFEAEIQSMPKFQPGEDSTADEEDSEERESLKQAIHHAYVQGAIWSMMRPPKVQETFFSSG